MEERTAKEIVQLFNELWPFTFITPQPAPLKIGIAQDIMDSGLPKDRPLSRHEIQKGLRLYCGVPKYKKKLRDAGRLRIGLDSNPAGQVSPEEAQKARDKLAAVEKTKLDKARAKAEAEASILAAKAAKEARKQRQAAEKLIKKMVAAETPEQKIERKKEKEVRKKQRHMRNRLQKDMQQMLDAGSSSATEIAEIQQRIAEIEQDIECMEQAHQEKLNQQQSMQVQVQGRQRTQRTVTVTRRRTFTVPDKNSG